MTNIPEGLFGGQSSMSDENNAYLGSLTQDTGGLSALDMQSTPYMQNRIEELHQHIDDYRNRKKDSLFGSLVKAFIDAQLNAATGGAFGAVKTGLQGGDLGDMAQSVALSQLGDYIGEHVATGMEYDINPFGEQANMLISQSPEVFGFLPAFTGATLDEMVQGKNLQDALVGGLSGSYQNLDLPSGEFDLGIDIQTPEFLRDLDKQVIQPVYQNVVKPVGDVVTDVYKAVDEPVREAGRVIDKEVLQPTYDVVKDVGNAIDDTIIDPLDQAIRDVDLPDVDFDFPDFPWEQVFATELGLTASGANTGSDAIVKPTELFENVYKQTNDIAPSELFATRNYLEGLF